MKVRNNTDTVLVVGDHSVPPHTVGEVRSDVWARYLKERPEFQAAVTDGRYEQMKELLDGDGDINCEFCRGRGWVIVDGGQQRCRCVRKKDVIANVQKIWPGFDLMRSAKLNERSPLIDKVRDDAWITAHDPVLQAHLRWVGIRMGEKWNARVKFDNDLLRAWFFTAKAKGVEIYDVDVSQSTLSEDPSIEDLALPPDLLVLVMGVKRTRNVAASECLMEALRLRQAVHKPTWIVDQPDYRLEDGKIEHLFSSPEVQHHIAPWLRIDLSSSQPMVSANPNHILQSPQTSLRPGKRLGSLSGTMGAKRGSTSNEDLVETEPRKKWRK